MGRRNDYQPKVGNAADRKKHRKVEGTGYPGERQSIMEATLAPLGYRDTAPEALDFQMLTDGQNFPYSQCSASCSVMRRTGSTGVPLTDKGVRGN